MPALPELVSNAWDEMDLPAVLTTADADGKPNAAFMAALKKYSEDKIVIADCVFAKSRENLLVNPQGSFLFITKDGKAYQIKGKLERHTEGEIYDDMIDWCDPDWKPQAAVVLNVEQVFCGAEQLV